MFENNKYRWDYVASKEKENTYEDMIDRLNIISPYDFEVLTNAEQDELVQIVLQTIRENNKYPIYYFNDEGIKKEIQKVIDKDVSFEGDMLITQSSLGLLLLDFMFPNLHHVKTWNLKDCMFDRFYDDVKLSKCIKCYMQRYPFENVRTMFFMCARFFWNSATNFAPMRAKAIYEKFCPVNGVIYDYSAGFGGRMLGALSSKNNYTYIGVDPCEDTYNNLEQLAKYITETAGRAGKCSIYNARSEYFEVADASADFAFSCPPFFKLEHYDDKDSQSDVVYPKYDDWLNCYVRNTIRHCVSALKPVGLFGIDIYDFFYNCRKYKIVEDVKRIAAEEGLLYQKGYPIISRNRKSYECSDNIEQVHIFKKE